MPPVTVRVPAPPTVDIVEGGVSYPPPERRGDVIVETPNSPPPVQAVAPLFVQPTPPTPTVPVYPPKQARN